MSKIEARLKEREEARKAAIVARRLEKEKDSRTEETYQYFTEQFSLQKTGLYKMERTKSDVNVHIIAVAIEERLEAAKSLPKSKLPEHFDTISGDVQSLHRLVSDATLYLAAFELKIIQEVGISVYSMCIV